MKSDSATLADEPGHLRPAPALVFDAEGTDSPTLAPAAAAVQGPISAEGHAALRGLFEEHYSFIWRIVRRLGVPAAAADDTAQQVFLVAARKIAEIEPGKGRSFLLGTAIRLAADARRSAARRRESASDALDAEPSAQPSPEQLTERKRALEVLDRVLEAMPFERRAVFVLFEIEGMETDEIAAALSLPRGTVSSRLRRAREDFQAIAKRTRARLERSARGGAR
jgi:RNA polymerase sigma-70 factor, ECF subfamily